MPIPLVHEHAVPFPATEYPIQIHFWEDLRLLLTLLLLLMMLLMLLRLRLLLIRWEEARFS